MNLPEYIKAMPRSQAIQFRKQLVVALGISASYARHLCNGRNSLPSKYAITVEQLTNGAIPRQISAPNHYPNEEYKEPYARVCQNITADMDK